MKRFFSEKFDVNYFSIESSSRVIFLFFLTLSTFFFSVFTIFLSFVFFSSSFPLHYFLQFNNNKTALTIPISVNVKKNKNSNKMNSFEWCCLLILKGSTYLFMNRFYITPNRKQKRWKDGLLNSRIVFHLLTNYLAITSRKHFAGKFLFNCLYD